MKYRKMGNSELIVSDICLGCMGFGEANKGQHSWTINEEKTREIIKIAIETGINFFDTAPVYQGGSSENFIGKALKDFSAREDFVIATKFIPRSTKELEQGISGEKHIENSLNKSLKNLGLEYVDLYIYHMWDYHTPIEDIMIGLDKMIKSGKARAIGISNCFAWQLAKANYFARSNNLTEFISMQGHYNLIAREEEREMIPFCKAENIAITPYSALAGGRLAKRRNEISKRLLEDNYAKLKYDNSMENDKVIIERVSEIAEKYGVSMAEVSLAWLISKGTIPIVGATKKSQLDGIIKAIDFNLERKDIEYLEELYLPHKLVGIMAENNNK